ncbi:heavy metal-binding domain-containing protein [Flavobacterium sp.]|uniref:heavy metal-binding domain-containing protein n=1 Tax=Flavobacterium sp. TaxID=239 RepID=UPI0038FC8DEB
MKKNEKNNFNNCSFNLVTISCNKKGVEQGTVDTHMMNNGSEMMNGDTDMKTYACPMHPEITGMKGDNCSKCGMALTERKTDKKDVSTIYSCPMHPEIQGKLNSKCSKCGMPLTEPVPEKAK